VVCYLHYQRFTKGDSNRAAKAFDRVSTSLSKKKRRFAGYSLFIFFVFHFEFWFNCKKVGGLIRNKPCKSFGFNALRQQHEWV